MEIYPVPNHLKSILKVDEDLSDMHDLDGKIVCTCGCQKFRIMHNNDRKYDDSLNYREQDGLKINAICSKCGKKHLLFDEATQGYGGFVCHDHKTADDKTLTGLKCKKCGADMFSVMIGIEAEDKEQFIEECVTEYPDEFSLEDFIDSFDWITITVRCESCGNVDEWISLELS